MSHRAPSREDRSALRAGTSLACADWRAFAGPGARWGRSVERMEAEAEARVAQAVAEAVAGESFAGVAPEWLGFLQRNLPVAAFAFNECGRILKSLSERCPWGGVAEGLALQASMQVRQAQSIVLYAADIEQRVGAMPMGTARTTWQTDRHWLGVHHFLEQAATCPDWGESLVAVNLCFEPLVGQLLRREVAIGLAHAHGDEVTPIVAETGQREWALTRQWTVAFTAFLLGDPQHGAANAALLARWIERQLPVAQQAARQLAGFAEHLDAGGAPVEPVIDDQHALLADAGMAVA